MRATKKYLEILLKRGVLLIPLNMWNVNNATKSKEKLGFGSKALLVSAYDRGMVINKRLITNASTSNRNRA